MLKKSNLFLLVFCSISIVLTTTIELNDRTNINYETSSDNVLNVQFQLGDIEIEQIQRNNEDFISISLENSHFLNIPGLPKLPQFNQLIEIPYEATPQIELINTEEEVYDLDDFDIDAEEGITQRKAGKKNTIAKKEEKGVSRWWEEGR